MIEIPENKESCNMTREERVDAIASVFLRGASVRTSLDVYGYGKIEQVRHTNQRTGEVSVWFDTASRASQSGDGYEREELFLPSEGEVHDALEQFRVKGWHAYYDTELRYYRVCNVHFQAGEYADRFMNWLF